MYVIDYKQKRVQDFFENLLIFKAHVRVCVRAQGHLARDNLQIKFSNWSAGLGFLPIATINILSLKSIRDSDFKDNFIIMKRER